jgi:predicted enzyme related to lactoylglutathione lyase
MTAPVFPEGRISYLLLPAADTDAAAAFYGAVFGWDISHRHGSTCFDDPHGTVSGHWLPGVAPADPPGMVLCVLVRDVAATLEKVVAGGGRVVEDVHGEPPELYATFADPTGNVLGLFEEGGR